MVASDWHTIPFNHTYLLGVVMITAFAKFRNYLSATLGFQTSDLRETNNAAPAPPVPTTPSQTEQSPPVTTSSVKRRLTAVVSTEGFIASDPDELAFPKDAFIWNVEETSVAGWWTGSYGGQRGRFPGTLSLLFTLINSDPGHKKRVT